jgi:hypothetical protein
MNGSRTLGPSEGHPDAWHPGSVRTGVVQFGQGGWFRSVLGPFSAVNCSPSRLYAMCRFSERDVKYTKSTTGRSGPATAAVVPRLLRSSNAIGNVVAIALTARIFALPPTLRLCGRANSASSPPSCCPCPLVAVVALRSAPPGAGRTPCMHGPPTI